ILMTTILVGRLVAIYGEKWYCYGSMIAVGVISLTAMLALTVKKCSGQGHIYIIFNLILLSIIGYSGEEWGSVISLLILLVLAKAAGWRKDSTVLRINDVCITVLLCF